MRGQTLTQDSHVLPKGRETTLTTRKLGVVGLMSRCPSNKLQVSDQTLKNDVTAILRKLRVTDRTQAVAQGMRPGWTAA